jgi:hypothetical protein
VYGLGQYAIEGGAVQAHSQSDLLVFFLRPTRAILHPEKIGLEPGHPLEGKAIAEVAMPSSEMADGWTISLVDDN